MEMLGWGKMLRSAEMEYVSIIMQEHLAHDTVEKLGELGVCQFTDLNGEVTAFKRYYTPFIRRCDELEKKLKFFEDEMVRHGIEPEIYTVSEFRNWCDNQRDTLSREHRALSLLDYWESIISERHRDYLAIATERERTAAVLYQAVQRRHVIEKASQFFLFETRSGGANVPAPAGAGVGISTGVSRRGELLADVEGGGTVNTSTIRRRVGANDEEDEMRFKHIAGIISTEDKVRFARIIFRASSGHAVVRFADIPGVLLDEKGNAHTKSVFAIFYRGRALTTKLDRICTAFSAHQHDIPSFEDERAVQAALNETRTVISDSIAWLQHERSSSQTTLRHLSLLIRKWRMGVSREKAIFRTLDCFQRQPERGTVSAQAWVLKTAVEQLRETLQECHVSAAQGGRMQPFYMDVVKSTRLPSPPTHFPVNKVTRVYQAIVNTYGVPRYGEVNPALFSIVTFPFLFGVMFGDIGHAFFLTLFSLYMVWNEQSLMKSKLGEMVMMCFKGRYILTFMGIFSIYCGLVYNDLFGVATVSFGGTRWYWPTTQNGTIAHTAEKSNGYDDVYPFGVDPEWHFASNSLAFFNSLKVKISVVLGISQMLFGVILKAVNAIHFKSSPDLYLEAIPQLIFFIALLGYMVFVIVYKWCVDWNNPAVVPGPPPSLIDTMINIMLKPGFVQEKLFNGQEQIQLIILFIVFVTVPIMLVGKPYYLSRAAKKGAHEETHHLLDEPSTGTGGGVGGATGGHEDGTALVNRTGGAGTGLSGNSSTPTAATAAGGTKTGGSAGAGAGAGAAADAATKDVHVDMDHDDSGIIIPSGGHGGGHESHSFGEMFTHQAIETIEFVLGSVSNTASYLRLWALSLAHTQLAAVFWERALIMTVELNNPVFLFIGYGAWAGASLGVLLGMDVLECFLHALRLHWVEFQNKFYKADGYKFTPFSFEELADLEK